MGYKPIFLLLLLETLFLFYFIIGSASQVVKRRLDKYNRLQRERTFKRMQRNVLQSNIAQNYDKSMDSSCLNNIFDAIFVISIKTRLETLSITLQQLDEESIDYILWEGHANYNPHSDELFKTFKTEWCPDFNRSD